MNEYTNPQNPSDFPDRPQTLSLGDLSPTPLECIGERTYFIRFADQGRYFQFNAVIGPGAPDSLRHDVVTAMNTFAPVPDDSCVQSAQLRAPGAYQPSFSSSSGAPGEAVTVSGFPPRTEGGAYVSPEGTRAEVWWNDGGSGVEGAAAATGQATELGFADTSGTCAYRISFTVPDVGPGVYPVTVRDASPNGFSWYGEENFTVTG
jgi:hypothetical protein